MDTERPGPGSQGGVRRQAVHPWSGDIGCLERVVSTLSIAVMLMRIDLCLGAFLPKLIDKDDHADIEKNGIWRHVKLLHQMSGHNGPR